MEMNKQMARKKKSPVLQNDNETVILKDVEYELVLRTKSTRDLVAFDFGLLFTKDVPIVQIYVDDELRAVLDSLMVDSDQVILKVNYYSPDVHVIVSPPSQDAPQTP
jgi:hypothetical protein